MKIQGKYIAAGAIAIVSLSAAFLFLQYKRIMNYTLKLKNLRLISFTQNSFVIDVLLAFDNKSDLSFDIVSQKYEVYINNKIITGVGNKNLRHIKPGISEIALRIAANPERILKEQGGMKGLLGLVSNPQATKIKIIIKLTVKFYLIKVNIPFTIEKTLAELLTTKEKK